MNSLCTAVNSNAQLFWDDPFHFQIILLIHEKWSTVIAGIIVRARIELKPFRQHKGMGSHWSNDQSHQRLSWGGIRACVGGGRTDQGATAVSLSAGWMRGISASPGVRGHAHAHPSTIGSPKTKNWSTRLRERRFEQPTTNLLSPDIREFTWFKSSIAILT